MSNSYRILSLDGGGVRGLLTCVVLARLQEAVPGWLEQVDLLAGTSTGGIIALGLAYGLSPVQLRNLYYEKSPLIFADSWRDDLRDLGKLLGAEYAAEPLSELLHETLGDTLLRDLRKQVLITSFDLDNDAAPPCPRTWKPKFFHNFEGSDSDGHRLAYKVALYTAMAPTYFPAMDGYIDGGVAVNNPSMAALAQTQDRRAEMARRPTLGDIRLLSLGTGQNPNYLRGGKLDWGYLQWARPLIDIMLSGSMGIADYQARQLLDSRYHRLAPILEGDIALDDWRQRDTLVRLGERLDLTPTIRWLHEKWR